MARKIRVPKRKMLRAPDEFIATSTKIFDYFRAHKKQVLALAGATLVVIIVFLGWRFHSQEVARDAFKRFDEALRYYHGDDNAESGDKDEMHRYTLALDKFKEVMDESPRTHMGSMAFLYSGHICYALKEFDESIRFYDGFLEKVPSDHPLRIFALDGLGYAYAAKGEHDKALVYFGKLIDGDKNPLSQTAHFHVSRCYEESGDKDKAIETYRRILADYPHSVYAALAREKINVLKR